MKNPAMQIGQGAGHLPCVIPRGSSVRERAVRDGAWLAGPICNGGIEPVGGEVRAHGGSGLGLLGLGNCRRPLSSDQLGPDQVPVVGPQRPAPKHAIRFTLHANAEFGARESAVLSSSELRQVNRRDPKALCECGHAASRQFGGVGSEVHSVMHFAQQVPKHNAQLSVMQPAYALKVKISSPRHLRRREKLLVLIEEAGGATELAIAVDTPKSHISAMKAGTRGIGDALAEKLEQKMGKDRGWMDAETTPVTLSAEALKFAQEFEKLTPAGRSKMKVLYQVARDGFDPINIKPAPGRDVSEPADLMLGGDSEIGGFDEIPAPASGKADKK